MMTQIMSNLLTMREVAELLGVDYGTIRTYRSKGLLPAPTKIVGIQTQPRPLWDPQTLEEWNSRRPGQGRGPRDRPEGSGAGRSIRYYERSPRHKHEDETYEPSPGFLEEFEAWKERNRGS